MSSLSATQRDHLLATLASNHYDLLVIGGGITGAGIALDAASRGLKTALVEKNDYASGTSSKSTKLIHGGLRYLKQLEVKLVREVGKERAVVHRLAPHLVLAEKMLLPLVKGGSYSGMATSFGLWVYDVLAGVQGEDKRRMLNKAETLQKEPLLRKDILQGSGYYAEYRTDDARLTIENIKAADRFGAHCANYLEVERFSYDQQGKVNGLFCLDRINNKPIKVNARFVVNAAGPWVDDLRSTDGALNGKRLFHSKGVHLVVPWERLPVRQSVYFDVPDGRMIFAIPRNRVTYVGTTDTPYQGDLNKIPVSIEDIDYLLYAVNQMFPCVQLQAEDVESTWAGLRPLIFEEGKSASEMSRKDEVFHSASGLISIAGGKLTGYRKMAERVVNLVQERFETESGQKLKPCQTKTIPLAEQPFSSAGELNTFFDSMDQLVREKGLPDFYGPYLVTNFGKAAADIIHNMPTDRAPEIALAISELRYTLEKEQTLHAMDFFNRRTGRLYFLRPSIAKVSEAVLQEMAAVLAWDEEQLLMERENVREATEAVLQFI